MTALSETIVFGQVFQLVYDPEAYEGSTYKIDGRYEFYTIPNTDEIIYFVVIEDAAGCCPQGLEVRFPDHITPPDSFENVLLKATAYPEPFEKNIYVYLDIYEFEILN